MRFSEAAQPEPADASGPRTQSPTNPLLGAAAAGRKRATARRALIVDDEPDVLRSLAQTLSHDGYEVTCASSLAQGIKILHERDFDLVLTDLYLGPTDLGIVRFRRLLLDAAAELADGIEPAAASVPEAYRVRSGAIVIDGALDFDDVLLARFGTPNGEVPVSH